MLPVKGFGEKRDDGNGLVAVAIDDDKGSQYALKWTADHLVTKGQTIILIHVNNKLQTIPNSLGHRVPISEVSEDVASAYRKQVESQTKGLFLPFRCFCTRKDIHCYDVVLEDTNIVKAITDYVARSAIEVLTVGASSHNAFLKKFKATDIPTGLSKAAPDFCTVYVIAKGKISSVRSASRSAPANSPLRSLILNHGSSKPEQMDMHLVHSIKADPSFASRNSTDDTDSIRCPFTRARGSNARPYGEISLSDTDISFVSSGRPSTDHMFPAFYDTMESGRPMRMSNIEDIFDPNRSFESAARLARKSMDTHTTHTSGTEFSTISSSHGTGETTWSSQTMEDVEAEMRRLRLELKQTMDMYATACKEAFTAKQKARDFHTWKMEEDKRLEEARLAEETALAMAEREKAKCKAAIEAAEVAQRIAELEAQKRVNAEMKAMTEAEEKRKALDALAHTDVRYRRYTIEEIETATEFFAENRKIGEGGYGPVYRCYLDHTPVAIKVLRPDASQGRSQFQQEVEVLSCIRHPNMVLLLGACPEYGCLVYEYMANGSLEDQLFRRDDMPVLSWQLRFRIAAEIATGLLFLHQAKPEPLVHRDLKPGNILLDRNYVSKISDVGLARLVPPTVANNVTQYRMTSTAGTFCYIDPEYQQTGMLGTKSDVYSLGVMLLQIITAKQPMGITHHVERSIEKGTFAEILDPAVPDWPLEEALCFAKIALKCAELRRKDRPDLGTDILPELNRLRAIAEENMQYMLLPGNTNHSPNHSQVFSRQDVISDPLSGYESIKSRSSMSSYMGQRP